MGYSGKISLILAELCIYNDSIGRTYIPQGTHTSPMLSNLALKQLDLRLIHISESYNFIYTRYADDLTFSSQNMDVTPAIMKKEIFSSIKESGFKINKDKVCELYPYEKQMVTGVIVNTESLSVDRTLIKRIRNMLYKLEKGILPDSQLGSLFNSIRFLLVVNKDKYYSYLDRFRESKPFYEERFK